MAGQSNVRIEAALAYVQRGVPVTPSFAPVRANAGGRWRRRAQWTCACGRAACATPTEHIATETAGRLTTTSAVETAWHDAPESNLMISPSEAIDIWDAPRELGALAMRLLEHTPRGVWPPVMQTATGRWIVVTSRLDDVAPHIAAHGTRLERVPADGLVLVPPSRRLTGSLHWLWSQRFPHTPLPEPWPILAAFAEAAERLHPWEIHDELAEAKAPAA